MDKQQKVELIEIGLGRTIDPFDPFDLTRETKRTKRRKASGLLGMLLPAPKPPALTLKRQARLIAEGNRVSNKGRPRHLHLPTSPNKIHKALKRTV